MIIRSIRLKNIKSYGEGPEGLGITVNFQPGVNRVAGRNGHGKTTLIEALGYALFFADPQNEENFKTATYFLRADEKEGEIDVVFEHKGELYRVERDFGQSKRRNKVIQLSDESTCAEGDDEVSAWLCRQLGFKQKEHLCALFANLIGVKQGRLTWPFDSKPAAAKEFFEPLLDVAIFRDSAACLNDALGKFKDLLVDQQKERAKVEGRIGELADCNEKIPSMESQVETLARKVERSRKQRDEAERRKQKWEEKRIAFESTKTVLDKANNELTVASSKQKVDQEHLDEAQKASATTARTEPGHKEFLKADERRRALEQRRTEKAALQQQRAEASNALTKWQERKESADNQSKTFVAQQHEFARLANSLRQQIAGCTIVLEKIRAESAHLSEIASVAKKSREIFSEWVNAPAKTAAENEKLLRNVLVDGEGESVLKAWADRQRLNDAADELGRKLVQAEHAKTSLANQLTQINGGVCPFLKQKCLQFDPTAIQSDLNMLEKEFAELTRDHHNSVADHGRAKKIFSDTVSTLSRKLSDDFEREQSKFDKRNLERVGQERDLENTNKHLALIERDSSELTRKIDANSNVSATAEAEAKVASARIVDLDEKLKTFTSLEQEIRQQDETKDKFAQDHKDYVQNQLLAAKIDSFRVALKISAEAEARAKEQVQQRFADFELANKDFDLSALENARNAVAITAAELNNDEKDLQVAERDLKQEKERLKEWKQACKQCDDIDVEICRLRAASEIAQLAGKVLKKAAPVVADNICKRIAENAQRIFNQINQDPIKLEWKSDPRYSLRVAPGDRGFGMLSGGEQTKLALAMTLAMIQKFSGLHFAVFDEPTYAVDADSRQKLADAILEAQKAAGLEQLIVVSHDDAFEGKIEHVVMVRKGAAGTEEVQRA